jgi:hypothetical protein
MILHIFPNETEKLAFVKQLVEKKIYKNFLNQMN